MKIKYYWNLIRGKTQAIKPAKLTLRNVWAVIQAWFRQKRRSLDGFDLPDHLYEQIIWRRTRVIERSPVCWEENQCVVCGCEVIGKTMEDRGCDGGCYPEMMPKDKWKAYKELFDIKLFE